MLKREPRENKIPIKFDLQTMDLLCKFSIDKKPYITRKHLSMMRDLMIKIDDVKYKQEPNLMARLVFMRRVLDAKLIQHMTNEKVVLSYAIDDPTHRSIIEEQILPEMDAMHLSNGDIDYVIKIITDNAKFGYIYNYVPELSELLEATMSDGYMDIGNINARFENAIGRIMNEMRKVKSLDATQKIFDLSTENIIDSMGDIIEDLNKPEAMLLTGYSRLNEMLGGGFMKGRIYCFMGSTGGFKSGLLINLLKSLKVNNTYRTKDITKKPMILYITQENSVKESVVRLFSTVSADSLKGMSAEDAVKAMKEGGLDLDSNGINIRIMFKQGGTVDTSMFYDVTADLETEGYETIAILHDYVKTMKPVDKNPDLRIAMCNVVREMKYVAVNLDIPVITAAQLNRDAAKTIDSAAGTSKTDITRQIGRSNIGESWSMIEELDWAGIVNREYHEQHFRDYLVLKNVKCRYANLQFQYFAQPFAFNNTFQLVEDIHEEKPLSVFTMSANYENIDDVNKVAGKHRGAKARPSVAEEQSRYTNDVSTDFTAFLGELAA